MVSTDNKYAKASVEAMHEVFGKDTVYIRSGGSIPIVTQFEKDLKIPSIMMGMGLPDDNLARSERVSFISRTSTRGIRVADLVLPEARRVISENGKIGRIRDTFTGNSPPTSASISVPPGTSTSSGEKLCFCSGIELHASSVFGHSSISQSC